MALFLKKIGVKSTVKCILPCMLGRRSSCYVSVGWWWWVQVPHQVGLAA